MFSQIKKTITDAEFSKVELFLLAIFSLIFAGFFFMTTEIQRLVMYIGFPFMLFYLYQERVWRHFKNAYSLIYLIAAFIIFYAVSTFWSDGADLDRVFAKAKLALIIPLVFTVFCLLVRKTEAWSLIIFAYLLSAIVTAIILLGLNFDVYVIDKVMTARLNGFGKASNPVQCAMMYSLALVALLFPSEYSFSVFKSRGVRVLGVALFFVVVFLTGGRGPMIALFATVIAVILIRGRLRHSIIAASLGIATLTVFLISPIDLFYAKTRGDNGRFEIWRQSVEEIQEKPFFGHGAAVENDREIYYAPLDVIMKATHEHSIYLSTLRHIGVFGFFVFLALVSYAAYYGIKIMRRNIDYTAAGFAIFGLIMGLVDFGGYFTNLGSAWLVFWFPLAFICMHGRYAQSLNPVPK